MEVLGTYPILSAFAYGKLLNSYGFSVPAQKSYPSSTVTTPVSIVSNADLVLIEITMVEVVNTSGQNSYKDLEAPLFSFVSFGNATTIYMQKYSVSYLTGFASYGFSFTSRGTLSISQSLISGSATAGYFNGITGSLTCFQYNS